MPTRLLLLNLPYPRPVIRKYQCSYYAQGFLMPPVELAYLGSAMRGWNKADVQLIDAVAGGFDDAQTIEAVRQAAPDVLVSLIGYGTFPEDVRVLDMLKAECPDLCVLCCGYLPTISPEEVLRHTSVDGILMHEPELTLAELFDRRARRESPAGIAGLATRAAAGQIVVGPPRPRIADLDALPWLDLSLLDLSRYGEPLIGSNIAPVMAIRGCPFPCAYCVTSYGAKLEKRSVPSLLDELETLWRDHGIRRLRFFGDTFTADSDWVIELCRGMRERGLHFRWTCRTRADRIEDDVLAAMKAAGCVRLYIGIESGSQKMLDYYCKQYTVEDVAARLAAARRHGMEMLGFFIVGAPIETEEDVDASIRLALDAGLDYVLVTRLQYWPGTTLFEQFKDQLDFSLFPFHLDVPDPEREALYYQWESRFYKRFYLSPTHLLHVLGRYWNRPLGLLRLGAHLLSYLFSPQARGTDDFI